MRIVVADDSAFIRNILKRAIESNIEALELVVCDSGVSAKQALEEKHADWLVTDLLMPEMTGQELIKSLATLERQPEIVVVSADVQQGTKDELKQMGVERYINKPLSPDKIEQLIGILKGEHHA